MTDSVKQNELAQSMQAWERKTGMKASWLLNRVPIDVLPLERFDRPVNHIRPPCVDEGMSLLRGLICNHMAGIADNYPAEEIIEMMKHPTGLSAKQIFYIREVIDH